MGGVMLKLKWKEYETEHGYQRGGYIGDGVIPDAKFAREAVEEFIAENTESISYFRSLVDGLEEETCLIVRANTKDRKKVIRYIFIGNTEECEGIKEMITKFWLMYNRPEQEAMKIPNVFWNNVAGVDNG